MNSGNPKIKTIQIRINIRRTQIQHSKQTHLYFGEGCTHELEIVCLQHILIQKWTQRNCKCELTCYFFGAKVDPSGEEEREKEGENRRISLVR